MKPVVTVYWKPTCTTCRRLVSLLKERGIAYEAINYYERPLRPAPIRRLLAKMREPVDALIRKKESVYRDLGLGKKTVPRSEAVELFAKYPDLLQRPIVERGDKAVLARPPEKVLELFEDAG